MLLTALFLGLVSQTPRLVPDVQYEPVVGDVVQIYRVVGRALRSAPVAFQLDDWQVLRKFMEANDDDGVKDLWTKKQVVFLESGVDVRVIESHGAVQMYARRGTNSVYNVYSIPAERYDVVRVLTGPQQGKLVCINRDWVKRCHLVAPKAKAKRK